MYLLVGKNHLLLLCKQLLTINFRCNTKHYLRKLPKVTVIIAFFEEHWSTLLRSIHSIINRSPPELIEEIILVDDHSQKEFPGKQLDKYIQESLPKVKLIRLPERSGLITARLEGARQAKSEVLVFFDSHIETVYNWLPPLLQPIVENRKTCVCPCIDYINHKNFVILKPYEGGRGSFDWEFSYNQLPILLEDLTDRTKPFRNPVMSGGNFAIGADFFWELGGFDTGLDMYGGEQYELSFKIWMCGGEIVAAPCSRVAHLRSVLNFKDVQKRNDLKMKNYKRVAEVWMDEYKNYLYARNPIFYELDPGDLTVQKALRDHLQCKSFKWFLEEIAFDLLEKYPPQMYAYGVIQSNEKPAYCLGLGSYNDTSDHSEPGLFACATNKTNPNYKQYWIFGEHKDIRTKRHICLDVPRIMPNGSILLFPCDKEMQSQLWEYDVENKFIISGFRNSSQCLEGDFKDSRVFINLCNYTNQNMKWNFGVVNYTSYL